MTRATLEPLLRASEEELESLRAAYWRRVRAGGAEVAGKLFLDKHPLNTLKLPLIARLFPSAKILFARRDPRDVVLSCFRRRFRMNPAMYQMLTPEERSAVLRCGDGPRGACAAGAGPGLVRRALRESGGRLCRRDTRASASSSASNGPAA